MRFLPAGCLVALAACATVLAPAPEVTEEEAARLRTAAQHARDCRNLTPPVLVKNVLPDYPAHVRRARIQGKVFLDGVITTDGVVVALRVVESPDRDLSAAALKAARSRRYRPAECSGQRVPVLVTIMSTFSLDPPASAYTSDGKVQATGAHSACENLQAPLLVKKVDPHYPAAVRNQLMQGKVVLTGKIGTDGLVHDIKVVSSPHPLLSQLAIEALEQWRYEPARCGGKPIQVSVSTVTTFGLR